MRPEIVSQSRREFLAHAGQLGALSLVSTSSFDLIERYAFPGSEKRGATGSQLSPARFPFQWRMLGPFRGGRCAAATGVPGRPSEFYFGHVNGGVWKTIDAGRVWFPIFDS